MRTLKWQRPLNEVLGVETVQKQLAGPKGHYDAEVVEQIDGQVLGTPKEKQDQAGNFLGLYKYRVFFADLDLEVDVTAPQLLKYNGLADVRLTNLTGGQYHISPKKTDRVSSGSWFKCEKIELIKKGGNQ